MSKSFAAALAACVLTVCALVATSAAHADVKAGVDAWNQGDYARAVNEWRPLAIGGNADAQFNLGQAYKLGRGVPVDLPVALEWFRKAAEQGHEKGADNYGLLLYQQGRLEDSIPYIKVSAERGEPRAQYVYATALFNGDITQKDWVRAYALMTRAAQAGVTQATTSLGQMDQYIPAAQRQEGLAMATAMARSHTPASAPAPQLAQAAPAAAPAPVVPPRVHPEVPPAPAVSRAPAPAAPAVAAAGPEPRPPVIKRNPRPQPAAAPVPAPAASGRYRVQLGAFREQGRAPALWKNLSGRVSGLSAFQPSYVLTNGLTRLLVGPLASVSEAQRLCGRITPTGTPCVVQGN
ncbi:SPOR domain-containing protein [Sphingobium nicotianae]|uniref:SEL1-like repeat protein n=1 Tax=Sphingobium nicotianae TaxID=2782607 RepID=A0A9X1AK31_9SPHN|nr:SPOR domain-containing protein [Sphingobium nicotianae]MBT2185700.1 SEL1-like repeat protein [Sphingobium nicotianae]